MPPTPSALAASAPAGPASALSAAVRASGALNPTTSLAPTPAGSLLTVSAANSTAQWSDDASATTLIVPPPSRGGSLAAHGPASVALRCTQCHHQLRLNDAELDDAVAHLSDVVAALEITPIDATPGTTPPAPPPDASTAIAPIPIPPAAAQMPKPDQSFVLVSPSARAASNATATTLHAAA
ncbi:hypothetical protein AMAG_17598, partial [Allomyces macrogynus ATCC 38327]